MQVNNAAKMFLPRLPGMEYGRVPKGDVVKVGENTYQTYRYKIEVKNGQVEVFDLKTKTSVKAWGDPHLHTSDGDKMQFHKGNVTIDLEDGTKLTLKPTAPNAQGISLVDGVQIMTPKGGVQVDNISGPGGPKGRMFADSARLDRAWADGTVLEARGEVDDLFFKTGKEVVGGDPTQRWGEHLLDGKGGRSDIDFGRPIPQFDIRDILSKLSKGVLRQMPPHQLRDVLGRIDELLKGLRDRAAGNAGGANGANGASGANGANPTQDLMSLLKRLLSQHGNALRELVNAIRGGAAGGANGAGSTGGASGAGSTGGAATNFTEQMKPVLNGLSGQINDLKQKLSDPNLSSEERTMIQMELQEKMQERMQLIQMLTSISKTEHEEKMAIIRNLRVGG